jgi:hypothetical protein
MSDETFRRAQERAARVRARRTKAPLTIGNCQFEFKCPRRWDALKSDGALDSRFCDVCMRRVHLCVTDDELRAHVAAGDCVVIYRGSQARGEDAEPRRPPTELLGVPGRD